MKMFDSIKKTMKEVIFDFVIKELKNLNTKELKEDTKKISEEINIRLKDIDQNFSNINNSIVSIIEEIVEEYKIEQSKIIKLEDLTKEELEEILISYSIYVEAATDVGKKAVNIYEFINKTKDKVIKIKQEEKVVSNKTINTLKEKINEDEKREEQEKKAFEDLEQSSSLSFIEDEENCDLEIETVEDEDDDLDFLSSAEIFEKYNDED
jgi:uncharacterized protein YfbU (UPF0304 family)